MMESKKWKLNITDGKSLLRGLLITLAGAALTFAAEQLPYVDFGQWTPFVVSFASLGINTGKKWLEGEK